MARLKSRARLKRERAQRQRVRALMARIAEDASRLVDGTFRAVPITPDTMAIVEALTTVKLLMRAYGPTWPKLIEPPKGKAPT